MRRRICAAVCAIVVSAVLWGCGGGADMREKDGAASTNMQENAGESVTVTGENNGAAGQENEDAGNDGAAGQSGSSGEDSALGQNDADDGQGAGQSVVGSAGAADQTAGAVQLAGTTFSILGDSISTYQGYNPVGYYAFFPDNGEVAEVKDTWWQRVADDLELTLYVNGSSSGATVAGDSTGTENPQCGCNELRTNDLSGPKGACPDRVVIFMGTNDMLKAIPLGENDGTGLVEEGEIKTFSDAYTLMLDKVQANYPLAEIYCCTLLPVGDYGTETPYVEFVNSGKLTSADYGETIIRIAENRGLPVIDLSDCGVTIENLHEMTTDGVHPTAAGMACIAEAVKRALVGQTQ